MIDIAVHFGKTPSEVDSQHVGVAHWVDLGVLGDRNHRLRIFGTTHEAAEALCRAFVACGARRVNRQVDATNDFLTNTAAFGPHRGETMRKTDQEKAVAHAQLMQRVANLDSPYVDLVTAAVDAIERSYGLISPAEAFLGDVLMNYAWGRLSPDKAQEALETYRSDLESMTEDVTDFVRRNPERFRELCAEVAASPVMAPAKVG